MKAQRATTLQCGQLSASRSTPLRWPAAVAARRKIIAVTDKSPALCVAGLGQGMLFESTP